MDRRQLEYVLAVVDHGGFGRAASSLHVTQSALSQAISSLERELGARLFHRNVRPVQLTSASEAVVGPARQVLRDFSSINAAVAETTGLLVGRLEIVCLPTLAHWAAIPLIGQFRRRYPGIRIQLSGPDSPRTSDLAEMVRRGASELGLTERGVSTHGLTEIDLGSHDYVAVLPPGTKLPKGRTVSLEYVLTVGLIVGPLWETSRPYRVILECCPQLIDDAVVVRIDHREAYIPLILGGAGSAILPRFQGELAAGGGAVIADLDVEIVRSLALVHRGAGLTPAAQAFCTFVTGS